MSGVVTAIAVVGAGTAIAQNEAGNRAADAAGNAAKAREAELRTAVGQGKQGLANAKARAQQVISDANSPAEMQALQKAFAQQGAALDRQAKLFESIDPAIMEASQQALSLLRGEEAKSLAPLRANMKRQRQQLVDRLREQLGPGAETSTAGMQALNRFDQQSSDSLFNAQQQSMGDLFGMGLQGERAKLGREQVVNQGTATMGQIGGLFGQSAGRKSAANASAAGIERQGFADLMNAQQGLAAGAGSNFVSEQLRAQQAGKFAGDIGSVATGAITSGLGG
jgi:hypothetical protein